MAAPSGTRFYPNGLGDYDHTNNIESVEFTAAETGTYAVRVYGYNIAETDPNGCQPFALVMSGPVTGDPAPAAPEFAVSTFSDRAVTGEAFYFDFEPLLSTSGWPEPTFDIAAPAGVDCETADSMFAFKTADGQRPCQRGFRHPAKCCGTGRRRGSDRYCRTSAQ